MILFEEKVPLKKNFYKIARHNLMALNGFSNHSETSK